MGNLPESRTETAIVGAAVSPNLINEIQDVIISEHASRIASRTKIVDGMLFVGRGGTYPGYGTGSTGGILGLGSVPYSCGLSFDIGDTITAIRLHVTDLAGTTMHFTFGPGAGWTSNTSLGNGTQQTLVATGTPWVVTSQRLSIDVSAVSGSGITSIQYAEIDYQPVAP